MILNATINALGGISPNPKAATHVKQFKDHEDKSSFSSSSKLQKSRVSYASYISGLSRSVASCETYQVDSCLPGPQRKQTAHLPGEQSVTGYVAA